MKWRLVVTRPFHLRGRFSPDYRAGSRGDYLPTGIYLIYVHSFCFSGRQSPLSQTAWSMPASPLQGRRGNPTRDQHRSWKAVPRFQPVLSPLTSCLCSSSWWTLEWHVSLCFRFGSSLTFEHRLLMTTRLRSVDFTVVNIFKKNPFSDVYNINAGILPERSSQPTF